MTGCDYDSHAFYNKEGVWRYHRDVNKILTPYDLAGALFFIDCTVFMFENEASGAGIWMFNYLCGKMSASQLVEHLKKEGHIPVPDELLSGDPDRYSREDVAKLFDFGNIPKDWIEPVIDFATEVKTLDEIKSINISVWE